MDNKMKPNFLHHPHRGQVVRELAQLGKIIEYHYGEGKNQYHAKKYYVLEVEAPLGLLMVGSI